ncbi:hypothetical protein [Sulfitobacter aestuariivivens]
MNSETTSIAKRRARELSLLVPVKCYEWFKDEDYPLDYSASKKDEDAKMRRKRGKEKLVTTGFVNAFTFVDDVGTAITANEVFGVPSLGSTIRASENEWLSRDYTREQDQHEILTLKAPVLPALGVGAQSVDRTIVDVSTHHPHHAAVQETEDEAVNRWVGVLADDLQEKIEEDCRSDLQVDPRAAAADQKQAICAAQGFALKILGGMLPLNQFSLKQFRHSSETQNACYQGLVLRRHHILKLGDFREIDAPLHVCITDYPTQPISKILGLKPKFSYPGPDRLIKVYEAVRPFSLNADLRRGAGVTLFERINEKKWSRVDITEEIFGWRNIPRGEVADMVRAVKGSTHISLAYESTNPKTGATMEKRFKEVKRKYLEETFLEGRVQTGQAKDIKAKRRDFKDIVSVVCDPKLLNELDPGKGIDIAAWNAQMQDKETGFKQEDMAENMERFSPATVLDKVLSRGWGVVKGTKLPRFGRPDFCVPATSVPKRIALDLFPEHERAGIYWPQTTRQYLSAMAQRESEATAFKYELNSAVQILALIYPAALTSDNLVPASSAGADGRTAIDGFVTTLTEGLFGMLDDEKKQAAYDSTRAVIERIENDEDFDGLARASEQIVREFVDAHLPAAFRVSEENMRRSMYELMENGQGSADKLVPSADWAALVTSLREIGEKMTKLMKDDSFDQHFHHHFYTYIERAEYNMRDMQGIERAEPDGTIVTNGSIGLPHEEMRARLKRIMTKEVADEAS